MACDLRALRPVEILPTAHGARARAGGLGVLSLLPTWVALHPTSLAEALLQRHRASSAAAASKRRNQSYRIRWRATRARFVPLRSCRPPTQTPARWITWRGCLHGQLGARSNPRRWPTLFFTDIAAGRRQRLPNAIFISFGFRAARPAHASPRGELADRPRSTRALADLALLTFCQRGARSTLRR